MDRRRILAAIFGTGALAAPSAARATTVAAPGTPSAAYSLSDATKVAFVLNNMRNHIDGMGGPENVRLALIVFGPPLEAFRGSSADPAIAKSLAALQQSGARVFACNNTMRAMHLTLADLLPGVAVAEKGGVVKIAELQMQGWAYVRP